MAKKPKVLFNRTMKVTRLEEKDVHKDEDNTHTEKATFTDGSGDKIALTMSKMPTGIVEGATIEINLLTSQTTLDEH